MMKRLLLGLLALTLILTAVACGAAPTETEADKKGEDLSQLTATELYSRAANAVALLPTARWTTQVSGGEEAYTLETLRIRDGYDRFSFSQTKNGTVRGVYFNGEQAWILSEDGNFTAPATTVSFQSFWDSEGFPIGCLSMEHFIEIGRDGMTVTYREGDETALAAFAALFDGPVTAVEGTATVTEELLIETEEIRVTGTLTDGAEGQITLRTTLTAHDEKDLSVAVALEDEGIMEVNDIRLPAILTRGWESLSSSDTAITLILEDEVTGGEAKYFRYSDGTLNRVGSDYSWQENIFTGYPGEAGEAVSAMLLSQVLAQGTTMRRVIYDTAAESAVIEDETTERDAQTDVLESFLPLQRGLTGAELTEDTQGYSVSFTLSGEEASRLAAAALSRFSVEAGAFLPDRLTAAGTVAFRKADGLMTSFSCDISGVTADGFTVTRRVSFTVETENVALSEIAPPVYLLDEGGID